MDGNAPAGESGPAPITAAGILHTEQRRRGRRPRSPFFVIFPNSINWDNYLLGIRPYFTLLNLYVLFDFSQYG